MSSFQSILIYNVFFNAEEADEHLSRKNDRENPKIVTISSKDNKEGESAKTKLLQTHLEQEPVSVKAT